MWIYVVTAQVKMPSGIVDEPVIEDNFDGTIRVQYNPKEDGVHEMILLHDGKPIQGKFPKSHKFRCNFSSLWFPAKKENGHLFNL